MKRYVAALRRAAEVIDVPGAPRTLRIDELRGGPTELAVSWSFENPEVEEPGSGRRRVQGTTTFLLPRSRKDTAVAAEAWWRDVQLDAAHRFRRQVDADSVVGEAPRTRLWTTEEAWGALLSYLTAGGATTLTETPGEIRVEHRDGETGIYRFSPEEWTDHLNRPILEASPDGDGHVVPAEAPLVHGIPVWASDELGEAWGSGGPVVVIRHGRILGIGEG